MHWSDRFNSHDADLISTLNRNGVSYIVVGGAAVAFYGCREVEDIDDLDLLIEPTINNATRLVCALSEAADQAGRPLETVPSPGI